MNFNHPALAEFAKVPSLTTESKLDLDIKEDTIIHATLYNQNHNYTVKIDIINNGMIMQEANVLLGDRYAKVNNLGKTYHRNHEDTESRDWYANAREILPAYGLQNLAVNRLLDYHGDKNFNKSFFALHTCKEDLDNHVRPPQKLGILCIEDHAWTLAFEDKRTEAQKLSNNRDGINKRYIGQFTIKNGDAI